MAFISAVSRANPALLFGLLGRWKPEKLFPALNAFSASALLSSASLKHLIVTPYEELAPALLGRGGVGGWLVRGGVTAESLAEFCAAVRLQRGGTRGGNPHAVVTER